MKVSEKSLELNVGAELLWHIRRAWGQKKAYLRGLTQQEERREGVDFFVHLDPATRLFAFQFKAPKGKVETTPYRYTLVNYQHEHLHALGAANPGCVFYVFPFYVTPRKLHAYVPKLLSDTWFLDVSPMTPASVFGNAMTRTIACSAGSARVNPEYSLSLLEDIPRSEERGIRPAAFARWYRRFLTTEQSDASSRLRSRARLNPWLSRGLRFIIVPRFDELVTSAD